MSGRKAHAVTTHAPLVAAAAAWILILIGCSANTLNQGDRVIMPQAIVPMSIELGWTKMEEGLVLSSFMYGYLVTQLPAGWLARTLTPLRILLVAVFAWSALTSLTPLAARRGHGGSIRLLLICRACMGVAEGLALPAIFQTFASTLPPEMISRAFALLMAGGAVGQVFVLFICPFISPWDSMFQVFGMTGFVWCAFAAALANRFCLLDSPQNHERIADSEDVPRATASVEGVGAALHDQAREVATAPLKSVSAPWLRLFTCRPVLAICAAHFAHAWHVYMLAAWLPTYLHEQLGVPMRNLYITALPFLFHAIGASLAGYIADTIVTRGLCRLVTLRRALTGIGLLGPAICLILFAHVRNVAHAVALTCLGYLLIGTAAAGFLANHADISASFVGLTFAISNTCATVPGILAGPLTALIVQHCSWTMVFYVAALVDVIGAVVYITFCTAHRVL